MDRQEIFNKIKDIISNDFEIEEIKFSEETNLKNDLGADSLDLVIIGFNIDACFGIKTSEKEIEEKWAEITVGYLVDLVESKLK